MRNRQLKIISWILLIILIDVFLFSFLPDSNWLEIFMSLIIILVVGGIGATFILKRYG